MFGVCLKFIFNYSWHAVLYCSQVYNMQSQHLYSLQNSHHRSPVTICHSMYLWSYRVYSVCCTFHPKDIFHSWTFVFLTLFPLDVKPTTSHLWHPSVCSPHVWVWFCFILFVLFYITHIDEIIQHLSFCPIYFA